MGCVLVMIGCAGGDDGGRVIAMDEIVSLGDEPSRHDSLLHHPFLITPASQLVVGVRHPKQVRQGSSHDFGPVLALADPSGLEEPHLAFSFEPELRLGA